MADSTSSGDIARDFDPTSDWPPEGAQVQMTGTTVATFRESPMPGWHVTDGRYARPFDSTGLLLAQRWAANPQMEVAESEVEDGVFGDPLIHALLSTPPETLTPTERPGGQS